jgi:hypothetical protein
MAGGSLKGLTQSALPDEAPPLAAPKGENISSGSTRLTCRAEGQVIAAELPSFTTVTPPDTGADSNSVLAQVGGCAVFRSTRSA